VRALLIGRFQPVHWGHVKLVEWLLTHYDEVVVAIGSADKALTFDNPFTPGERLEMFRRHFGGNCRILYCAVPDTNGPTSLWGAYLRHWCPTHHVVYSNNPGRPPPWRIGA
jgi:nicotinamide-nucleotide adenylyltransferase